MVKPRSHGIPKPPDLIDRADEWTRLATAWASDKPELAFVVGRRRVGKSYLLARFAHAVDGIYYQATRRTEGEQLLNLSQVIGARFQDAALLEGVPFPTWEALFDYLIRRADGKRLLLVLDEFPFLATAAPALPSIVQSLWDHRWQGSRIKVVLSGSHITAMRQLEAADQPLFGRRTARLAFRPFPYPYLPEFLPQASPQDWLRAYGIFGGLPGHLGLLDPALDVGENASSLVLDPSGRLFDEAQHMLDGFLGDADIHYSIVEAIARGAQSWGKITGRLKKPSGSVTRPMRWLIEMQVVTRVVPITQMADEDSRRAVYRITDPYVAFWHRFVAPIVNAGMAELVEPSRLWTTLVLPRLDDYMGGVFEEVCREFVRRGSTLPFAPMQVGQWWSADSRHEIDVVALGADGEVLVGECKWGEVTAADLTALQQRADLLLRELTGVRRVYLALFSGRSLEDTAVRQAVADGSVLHFDAQALFR